MGFVFLREVGDWKLSRDSLLKEITSLLKHRQVPLGQGLVKIF